MKLILLSILMSFSLVANAYTIREGGRTVGAGQVTEIVSSQVEQSEEEVDEVLSELGRRIGYHLAFQEELMAGTLYVSKNGLDNDCDGVDDDCDGLGDDAYRAEFTAIPLRGDDEKTLPIHLTRTLNTVIGAATANLSENPRYKKKNNIAILSGIAHTSFASVDKGNPIGEAFKDADKCRQFREDFVGQVTERMAGEKYDDEMIKRARDMYSKALKRMERHVKKHRHTRRRVEVLKSNNSFNRTPEIIAAVSEQTGVSREAIEKITFAVENVIQEVLSNGDTVRVTGLGTFKLGAGVTGLETPAKPLLKGEPNKDPGAPIGEIAIDSIFTPIGWVPSTSTQIERNANNRGGGVCAYGKCFCTHYYSGDDSDGLSSRAKEKANRTKCSSQRRTAETHAVMDEATRASNEDSLKFYDKDNKAAGTRVRKTMQELKTLQQDIRKEVQDKKNNG